MTRLSVLSSISDPRSIARVMAALDGLNAAEQTAFLGWLQREVKTRRVVTISRAMIQKGVERAKELAQDARTE